MNANGKTKSFAIQKRVTSSNTRCVFVFIIEKTVNQIIIKFFSITLRLIEPDRLTIFRKYSALRA